MIKDKIDSTDIGLKGLVTVELFDAKTGNLESRVQKENFIAMGSKKWWARLQRDSIIDKMPTQIKNTVYDKEKSFNAQYFFNRIILTDDTSPEQPDIEILPKGNLIGQVDIRNVATSSHKTAGVFNLNESYIDDEKIHIVGDFGTDRGNGTFQSIGFVNCSKGYNVYNNYLEAYYGVTEYLDYKGSGATSNLTIKMGNKLIYSTRGYSQSFYYFDLDNPEAGLQILFEVSSSFDITGLTHNNEHIFVAEYDYNIREYDLNGGLINTITTEVPDIYGIYFDIAEDVFYVTSASSYDNPINEPWNMCMYKVSKTGSILEIFPFIFRDSYYKVGDRLADGSFVFWRNGNSQNIIIQNFDKNYSCFFDVLGTQSYSSLAIDKDTNNAYRISVFNMDDYDYNVAKLYPMALCSRVLLSSPQTKTNTQTMKVTYDLYYTDWKNII